MHRLLLESADSPIQSVRIWTAELDRVTTAELQKLGEHLAPEEQTRATKFHFARDRQHFVTTRGLLRHLLGQVLHQPPAEVRFTYGQHGKPMLAASLQEEGDLHFNLSHSAGWAMFAVARARAVGIDLENGARLERSEEHLAQLAARVLSARELLIWQTIAQPEAQRAAFLRAWVRKEAVAKATGQGVFQGLTSMDLILDAGAPVSSMVLRLLELPEGIPKHWLLHDLSAPEGFAAAICVTGRREANVASGDRAVSAEESNA